MASPINIHVYSDALVLLGTAGVVIPLVRRFGFNPVLGYLGAGAILGPLGLGSFIERFPLLYWFTVVDAKNVAGIADLGVVFLLFLIGMELSYERLKAMRRLVFGLGSLQIVLSHAGDRRSRDARRQQAAGGAHPRCLPGAVVDRHRHRGAFQAGAAEHHSGPRQLRGPAGAGSGGGAAAAVHLYLRRRRFRFGRRDAPAGARQRRHRARRHRRSSAAW